MHIENLEIIAGHGRMAAAHDMGMRDVPMIILSHLTDAPYNVKVKSIGSMGKIKHDEFAMVSGEMTQAEFTEFLRTFMRHTNGYSMDGALHYLFMGWKHVGEISTAGAAVYNDFKNICIWNKTKNGVLNISDNNHLILKAFATAWKYREIYEECGDVDTVAKKVGSTPRTIYRYLDIAYMNPKRVNQILDGTIICTYKNLLNDSKQYSL